MRDSVYWLSNFLDYRDITEDIFQMFQKFS